MPGFMERVAGLLGTVQDAAFPVSSFGGLLSPEQAQEAQRQSQMTAGLEMLRASGPSPFPTSPLSNIATGLRAGQQAGQQSAATQLQGELIQAQISGLGARSKRDRAEAEQLQGGLFQGVGATQQMMNIVARAAGGQQVDPALLEMSVQSLSQPRTMTNAQGQTTTFPGINARAILDGTMTAEQAVQDAQQGGGAPGVFGTTDPRPTEGERRAGAAATSMTTQIDNLDKVFAANPEFSPTAFSNMAAEIAGDNFFGRTLSSPGFQQYKSAASQWAAARVLLISGVTARQEEVDRALNDYFAWPGNDEATVKFRDMSRLQESINAVRQGTKAINQADGTVIPARLTETEAQKQISALEARLRTAERSYNSLSAEAREGQQDFGPTGDDVTEGSTAKRSDGVRVVAQNGRWVRIEGVQ